MMDAAVMERTTDATVRIGSMELRFRVETPELVMFDFVVPADAKVPAPHYHESVDEAVYGLSGTMTTTVDGTRHEVRAGDVVHIPRGAVHHHANLHAETAKVLIVLTPGSIGRAYFEEMAAALRNPGPPDMDVLLGIMRRHGLVPAKG
ncbi:cupin domain-containing protein [Falsiroseomonas sp. HW251]|uniref:cupin domain-containing protein n=1 Tax=Falsiroseomonas sp. HW251 TaxID=3390998 RepID=UPI003D310198